jgi:REP element-mobilizing transposase RayT
MTTKPGRQTIRLKRHDYTSECSYFLTMCTHKRNHLFGKIIDWKIVLNDFGKIAHQCWLQIPNHFPNAEIDEYIIMPNHIHGIIHMHPVGANQYSPALLTTGNKSKIDNKFKNNTTQSQKVNNDPNENDVELFKNDGYGFAWGMRANDDSRGIRAYDDSRAIRAYDDSRAIRANDDSPLRDRRWENGTSNSIGSIIRGFKIGVTKCVRQRDPEFTVWQRNYWEHIIRDRDQYCRIKQYIINNPGKWYYDKLNGGSGNKVLENSIIYGYESWMV